MERRDLATLLLLAALWGGAFLLMRIAAPEFGAAPLTLLRVGGGALVLLPFIGIKALRQVAASHGVAIGAVGLLGAALPYACFNFASQHLPAALSSLLNASTPLFAAGLAVQLGTERLDRWRRGGLALGVLGVALVAATRPGASNVGSTPLDQGLAAAACLAAATSYAVAAHLARRHLSATSAGAVAASTQCAAAALVLLPALYRWPLEAPGTHAWCAAIALAVLCTGFANLLYFRLIARAGAPAATTVTFLVPLFAAGWAGSVLGEPLSPELAAGGALILLGCALATGTVNARCIQALRGNVTRAIHRGNPTRSR